MYVHFFDSGHRSLEVVFGPCFHCTTELDRLTLTSRKHAQDSRHPQEAKPIRTWWCHWQTKQMSSGKTNCFPALLILPQIRNCTSTLASLRESFKESNSSSRVSPLGSSESPFCPFCVMFISVLGWVFYSDVGVKACSWFLFCFVLFFKLFCENFCTCFFNLSCIIWMRWHTHRNLIPSICMKYWFFFHWVLYSLMEYHW